LRHRNTTGRPAEAGEINQLDHRPILHLRPLATLRTRLWADSGLHGDLKPADSGSATCNTLTADRPINTSHARIAFNTAGAPQSSDGVRHRQTPSALLRTRDPHIPLIREEPEVGRDKGGIGLECRAEPTLGTKVDPDIAAFEPAPSATCLHRWLWHRGQAQQVTVEGSSQGFTTDGHG
jgi:hypothetical protein